MRLPRLLLLVLILTFPILGFLLHLSDFPYTLQSNYSDFSITHYPNAVYLVNSIKNFGQLPLWSNTILSGYPFAANPLAGLWYPPGWIAYLFPLPAGLNLLTAFHLVWGGVGMFIFLKRKGLSDFSSILGALAFETLPRIWAHSAAGHLTLVYALSWTPWLLWSEIVPWARRRWLPGLILGLILLADVRWAVYAGILWGVFRLALSGGFVELTRRGKLSWLAESIRQPVVGLALAAVLLIPLAEYTAASTRSGLSASETLAFSLQPEQLLGLIFPDLTGYVEWVLYPGAVGIIAFLWAWLDKNLRQKTRLLRWGIIFSVLLSLGENFLPATWLFGIPGLDLLRVPPRFMLVGGILFSILAAVWINHLAQITEPYAGLFKATRLGLVGFCFSALVLLAAFWAVTDKPPVGIIWATLGYFTLVAVLFVFMSIPWQKNIVLFSVLVILLLDAPLFDNLRLAFHDSEVEFRQGEKATEYLHSQGGKFRVYSPSYSLPQHTTAFYGLELADGIDPLQLRSYSQFFERASGVENASYSVTLPFYKTANPSVDNQYSQPNLNLLGLLNVQYVVSEFELNIPGLKYLQKIESSWIYENTEAFPRVWVQDGLSNSIREVGEAAVQDYSPNLIEIAATGPGLLVLSEINYPGWKATVDGIPASIQDYHGILRAIDLPEGTHAVKFTFYPVGVFLGVGISLLMLIGIWLNYRLDHDH